MDQNRHNPPCLMHVIYSLGIGGAEKLAFDMVMGMPVGRYRPIVLCVGEDGPLREAFEQKGCTVYYRPNTLGETLSIVSWIRGVIEREEVRVIHAHQYNPLYYSVLAAVGNRRLNLVYTEHGRIHPERFNWKRYLTNPLLALRIDHIVSISESTRGAMSRYDNLPSRRIQVIHNGVDLGSLNPQLDLQQKRHSLGIGATSRIIGTASRLEEIKNIPMMLRGFQKVLASVPDTVLVIAGQGSEGARLQALAGELGIAGQVRFLGLRSDVPELFPLIEVFLLVSYTEGISITLLEAMGSGVPAVVTRVGGNPEVVVEGETGYLVEVDDEAGLATRILELLGTPRKAARLGEAGRERVASRFSFERMMQSYLMLYQGRDGERHEIR